MHLLGISAEISLDAEVTNNIAYRPGTVNGKHLATGGLNQVLGCTNSHCPDRFLKSNMYKLLLCLNSNQLTYLTLLHTIVLIYNIVKVTVAYFLAKQNKYSNILFFSLGNILSCKVTCIV